MTDRILVFVPCYNCAPQVGRVLARVSGAVARHVAEVLILDNGSRDGTPEAALEAAPRAQAPRVTIARNRENYNLGGSHKAAYAYATREGFTHVVTLHGDDQGDLGDMLPVFDAALHRRADACMGARFIPGARLAGYSAFRVIGNHVFNLIFTLTARRRIGDLGSGLNCLARAAFADPALQRLPDDLHFNPYLLLDLYARRRRVTFFPISWREEDQVSNVKMASQALKTLGAAWSYTRSRRVFRARDFRAVPRATYGFDVLARFEHGVRVG